MLSSFGRVFGRILAYILIALVIFFCSKQCAKALTYTAEDSVMSTNYYNYFNGVTKNLDYNDKYVAFSYSCNGSGTYYSTCYMLCYSENLTIINNTISGSCKYTRFNYDSGYLRVNTGTDNSFSVTGNSFYTNLSKNYSSLESGVGTFEICTLCFFGFVIVNYIIRGLFFKS